ncbi:MAG: S8 family serine peptidase [Dehalococcoidia bacterium]|nr:S8 family serine peptidase [Dehalococcoidia bacterium]
MSNLFHTRRFAGVAILAFLLSAIGLVAGGPRVADSAPGNPTDTIIVAFETNANEAAIAALIEANASSEVEAIPALGMKVLRVPPGQDAADVAARFARNPLVRFAEPNDLVYHEVIPDDPYYGQAWHLPKIEAPAAWDGPKANGVLVAVCDTGVNGGLPDLAPIVRGDLGWNTASNNNDWSPIAGHGTLVSGALAAATDNGIGVAGVAWGAQIIPVRITNNTTGTAYVSDAAKCIQYAADNGARVINLSYRMASYSSIDTAAAYARNRGAVTLVAAGNDGIDPGWQDFPNFLAVSATISNDTRASFSNFGTYIDIAAPGYNIQTTTWGGGYAGASGTSLASPVAAGVVALIFGANPGLSAVDAEAILRQSADDLGDAGEDAFFGSGRVNARTAVAMAGGGSAPPPPADTTPPAVSLTAPAAGATVAGVVTVAASASDSVGVTKVEFWLDGQLKATDTSSPYAIAWDSATVADGSHSWTARAFDAAGNAGSASVSFSVLNASQSFSDPTPPSVSVTSPGDGSTVASTVTVSASASDNVGVTKVEFWLDGQLKATDTSSPYAFALDSTTVADGAHSWTALAFDAAGNVASASVSFTVSNAPAPDPNPQPISETFTGKLGGRNQPSNRSHGVTVRSDGPMTVVLSWKGKAQLPYTVYNASGQAIQGGAVSGQASTVANLPAGSYTVVVSLVNGQASYTLMVTHY